VADEHDDWLQSAFGFDIRKALPNVRIGMGIPGVETLSANTYERGYQDGITGSESSPGPLNDEETAKYEAGFSKGHAKYLEKLSESDSGVSDSIDSEPNPLDSKAYDQGYWTGVKGGMAVCPYSGSEAQKSYDLGYAAGKNESMAKAAPVKAEPLSAEKLKSDKEEAEERERNKSWAEKRADFFEDLKRTSPEEVQPKTVESPPPEPPGLFE
jgi:ribosome modulation factor